MDPSQPTLSQNSQRASEDGTFILNKILGDGSVAADECTYKCKYCVLIYSNNYETNVKSQVLKNVNLN